MVGYFKDRFNEQTVLQVVELGGENHQNATGTKEP